MNSATGIWSWHRKETWKQLLQEGFWGGSSRGLQPLPVFVQHLPALLSSAANCFRPIMPYWNQNAKCNAYASVRSEELVLVLGQFQVWRCRILSTPIPWGEERERPSDKCSCPILRTQWSFDFFFNSGTITWHALPLLPSLRVETQARLIPMSGRAKIWTQNSHSKIHYITTQFQKGELKSLWSGGKEPNRSLGFPRPESVPFATKLISSAWLRLILKDMALFHSCPYG